MKNQPVRCLLFDLDDTLLENSRMAMPVVFLKAVSTLRRQVGAVRAYQSLRSLGEARFGNGGSSLNHNRFLSALEETSRLARKDTESFFNEIFPNVLLNCRHHFKPILAAQQFFRSIPNHVLRVLATNPVLNETCTNLRIEWAGLKTEDFRFVTHSQNMTHSKPEPQYYEEILTRLQNDGIEREDCLFIGNDPINDGAAVNSGISTVLISPRTRELKILKKARNDACLYQASWATLPQLIKF